MKIAQVFKTIIRAAVLVPLMKTLNAFGKLNAFAMCKQIFNNREISSETDLSHGSICSILDDYLNINRVSSCVFPKYPVL